jgi:hypothetical protein
MIQFIMRKDGKILEKELVSPNAAKELIIACIVGLVPDQKAADEQIQQIIKNVNDGGTVSVTNPDTGVEFIFQTPSIKKEKDAINDRHNGLH